MLKNIFTTKIIPIIIGATLSFTGIMVYSKIKSNDKMEMDPNIIISEDTKTIQDALDEANERVKDGMLAISITTEPTYPDGNSLGTLMIKNPAENTKNFTVKFVLSETNEEVYKSGLIPPGGALEKDKLNKSLKKGEYPAVAYFESYDDNNEKVGEVGIDITIKVLK